MADIDLDVVRREFVALIGLFENAALIASEGQGVKSLDGAHREFTRLLSTTDRIRKRLIILEGRVR